jgi:hypothetical protein
VGEILHFLFGFGIFVNSEAAGWTVGVLHLIATLTGVPQDCPMSYDKLRSNAYILQTSPRPHTLSIQNPLPIATAAAGRVLLKTPLVTVISIYVFSSTLFRFYDFFDHPASISDA